MRKVYFTFLFALILVGGHAASVLIPMDPGQKNHLKAYGMAFTLLQKGVDVDWLLNYRGGSFLTTYSSYIINECTVRQISFEVLSDVNTNVILGEIGDPKVNMNIVRLQTAPRIAVYSPKNEFVQDESDAVIAVLDFAEIPYDIIYDEEVINDALAKYDWLHVHHEDFTGQHGRFLRRDSDRIEAKIQETIAARLGYSKISALKLDVAKRIKAFCAGGGYIFAMCSGAETLDVALAAEGVDICESIFDDDGMDPDAQGKLDFDKTFAFENFILEPGYSRRFSDINAISRGPGYYEDDEYFTLFVFSAKWDIIPALLTQNHETMIKEFIGQTTVFNRARVKPTVLILGENRNENTVRYIYGELGKGHWTFYSGHDPEGWPGRGRKRNLSLHPNSPGYRLILNNVLFPSARKKKQKT